MIGPSVTSTVQGLRWDGRRGSAFVDPIVTKDSRAMNRKNLLVAAFFLGLMICLMALLAGALDPNTTWGYRLGWIGGGVFCIVMMFVSHFRRDKAPDVLRQAGLPCFERDGLCFGVMGQVQHGRAHVCLIYQNRYHSPCSAEVLLRPAREEGEANMRRLRFRISCPASGVGQLIEDWPIPEELQGRRVNFLLGADVEYPEGRATMVRFKDGAPVGSVSSVEHPYEVMIFGKYATLQVEAPTGVGSRPLAPAPDPERALEKDAGEVISGTERLAAADAGPEEAPAAGAAEAVESAERWLTGERVQEALTSVQDPESRRAQEAGVKERRRRDWADRCSQAILGGGLGVLLLGYGVLGFMNGWRSPGKIFGIVVGGCLVLGVLVVGADLVRELFTPAELRPPENLAETCRTYYHAAFTKFKKAEGDFALVCRCLAGPALQAVEANAGSLPALFGAWSKVREEFLAEDATCQVGDFVILEKPRSGGEAVDVIIGLRGPRFGRLAFRNVAVRGAGRWYLTAAEPIPVYREDAAAGLGFDG